MTVKLGMTHAQLIDAINSDIDLIKDQGSKIITKEFPASETETSSVQLDTKCQGKDYMFVFMDYGILEPSKYSLSADGLTVNFSPAIPANHKIIIRYFTPGSSFTNYVTDEFQSNLLNYTTNRILEIPQDIKLELNNGTLTLKAGSKVYVPNGFEADGTTPKFDEFITSNDAVDHDFGNASREVAFLMTKSDIANTISVWSGKQVVSGTSAPDFSSTGYWGVWYDTSNNIIKIQDGTNEWKDLRGFSLPICLVSSSSSAVTSLDQIFNGFGYIGSTVFALPGVKVQIPNGRNEDGTCKVIESTTTTVVTNSYSDSVEMNWYITSSGTISYYGSNYIKLTENNLWESTDGIGYILKGVVVATSAVTSGVISDWKPCTVDSVANSNASNFSQAGRSYLSGLGMPSNRYIDLTAGASNSTYTAPANGWFSAMNGNGKNGFCCLLNLTKKIGNSNPAAQGITDGISCVPVMTGDTVVLRYSNTFNELNEGWFRFIYAQGNQ